MFPPRSATVPLPVCSTTMRDRFFTPLAPVLDWFVVLFAGWLYAVALKYFVLPSRIILTGTEGIAAAISYYFDSYWLFIGLYLLFQTGLLIFAYRSVSQVFALRSLVVVGTVVFALALLPEIQFARPEPEHERMILVIFGGLLAGVAKAIAFKRRGSTGDEDILAAFFAMKYLKPVGSIGVLAAIVSTVFGLSLDLLKNQQFASMINTLMYTCIYIFVASETLNNLYRKFKLTMFVVITRTPEVIGAAIQQALPHRTHTMQTGKGGYSGQPFSMVSTILTHEELPQIIPAVEQLDPSCFHYHHDIEGISSRYYISPIG